MIFRPELVKLILQGKKNMTRRKVGEQAECRYRVGHAYQVQPGRGKSGMFPITIQATRAERLGDLSLKDAKREGFVTTQDFIDYWTSLYERWNPELRVWVITFAVGDATDTPNLLAARPGAPHGDYVTEPRLAMKGEPEAIRQADATRYSTFARARDDEQRRQQLREARDKIADGVKLAREAVNGDGFDRDAKKTVRALEHHVQALDRKVS